MITRDTIVVAADDLSLADLDGETVVLSIRTGNYYGLNKVAARIIELSSKPGSVGQMIDTLTQEFEVDPETLLQDIAQFLQELEEAKLVRIESGATVS